MAKGNFFLGTARGSVGDLTFYQNRGQQCARVRKRTIGNPKSNSQLVTRAILSTVSKAYQAGRAIFDHSFEGRKQGQENQDRFSKLNIAALRAAFNTDMQTEGVSDFTAKGRFVQRNAMGPVPFSFIASEGSLIQNFINLGQSGTDPEWEIDFPAVVPGHQSTPPETVSTYLDRCGVKVGDIFTIVGFGYEDMGNYSIYDSFPARFQFVRLICNPAQGILSTDVENTNWDQVFDVDVQTPGLMDLGSVFYGPMSAAHAIKIDDFGMDAIGAFGVIRSRDDRDLRSNCVLKCSFDFAEMSSEDYQWGLSSLKLTNGWRSQSPGAEDSPLILEGGNVAAALDELGQ